MKVILTAFGGKLKSDPMDWPEDTGMQIKLILDNPKTSAWPTIEEEEMASSKTTKTVCTFERQRKTLYLAVEDERDLEAVEYVLVDISK